MEAKRLEKRMFSMKKINWLVVATGGLARTVVKNCSRDIIYDADLLLKGLWVLYDRNRKS